MTNEAKGIGKGLIIGVLAGAAVGSVIALLYAPKSGKELRGNIMTKSHDFVEDVDEYIGNTSDKISELMHLGKKKSDKIAAETKKKIDALLSEADKLLTEAKDKSVNAAHHAKHIF